eukprot:5398660-Pyramimonas_sp.AAC.1
MPRSPALMGWIGLQGCCRAVVPYDWSEKNWRHLGRSLAAMPIPVVQALSEQTLSAVGAHND